MNSEIISVTVTYREPVTFHLRMIGLDEESQLRQKMFGLTDEEKKAKSYQNNIDMLADLAEEMPKGLFPNHPAEDAERDPKTAYIEDFGSPAAAIKTFFQEKSVMRERIAEYAVRGYFLRLSPDVSFS